MQDLAAAIDAIPGWTWGFALFAAGLSVAVQCHAHAAQAFHQWRLDRRLARNSYIGRDEMNEYRLAIGEELAPLDGIKVVRKALVEAVFVGAPVWLASRHLEHWWQAAMLGVFAITALAGWWRWLNEPPELRAKAGIRDVSVPREAWLGLVGGVAMAGLILLFIAALV